jgi:hypothetical protein
MSFIVQAPQHKIIFLTSKKNLIQYLTKFSQHNFKVFPQLINNFALVKTIEIVVNSRRRKY